MGLARSSVETNRVVTGRLFCENNMKELFSARNTWESSSERIIQGHDKGKATDVSHLPLQFRKEGQFF